MSSGLLATEQGVLEVQDAIRGHELDGWLLYEFRGLNPISAALLGLGKTTRRGFVLIPDEGEPVALTHSIEASSWRHWPFGRRTYSSWSEMETEVAKLVDGRSRLAMEVSPGAAVPTLHYVPAGMASVLLALGVSSVRALRKPKSPPAEKAFPSPVTMTAAPAARVVGGPPCAASSMRSLPSSAPLNSATF